MGTLQGLKLASTGWVGPLGRNSVHPDSLGSSASPGKLYCPPGTGRREDALFPASCQETDAQIWETEVRTKPQWLHLLLSPLQPQLGGSTFPPQSSTGSSGSPQPHLNASKKQNKVGARPWEL